MKYSTDKFLEWLYNENLKSLPAVSEKNLSDELDIKREKLKKILGLDKLEQIKSAISIKQKQQSDFEYGIIEDFDIEILPNLISRLFVLIPENPNGGAILYCHGHGEGGCQKSFDKKYESQYHKCIPLHMAEHGYTVFIPEFVGYGESVKQNYKDKDFSGCYANATELLLHGITLSGLRVYQAMRAADFAFGHFGFKKLSVYGVSGGGQVASFFSALDFRPNAVVISSYANTFAESILSMRHCIDNYIPNILSVGESPEIIALCAPKPLLISNGKNDPIFPQKGFKSAISQICRIYELSGKTQNFEWELFDGYHEVSLSRTFDFLQKYF